MLHVKINIENNMIDIVKKNFGPWFEETFLEIRK